VGQKHSRNRERAQAVAPVCLPVVKPGCHAAFLAFAYGAQRPRVVAAAPATPVVEDVAVTIAIDCTETAGGKACTQCKTVKPLTEFYLEAGRSTRREAHCKACNADAGTATADAPGVALSRYAVVGSLQRGDRPDGTLRAHNDLTRTGIVHRGAVSAAITGYLNATGARL
jgi:hypothetical protein